jgi:3D (Asp-Asp-Asp) domain-containing protein
MFLSVMMSAVSLFSVEPGWRPVVMDVSAYCPCSKCCGKWADGITSSGTPARGRLVAAPPKYAFGTDMIIPGYGRAEVQDRGSAIKTAGQTVNGRRLRYDRIALLMPTHSQAIRFGRAKLTVLVRGR